MEIITDSFGDKHVCREFVYCTIHAKVTCFTMYTRYAIMYDKCTEDIYNLPQHVTSGTVCLSIM